jgi:hypothetical protein
MNRTALLLVLIAACFALANAADLTPSPTPMPEQAPTLSRYDVALVKLDQPYKVTLPNGQTVEYTRAYLVRFFGVFAKKNGVALRLQIGDRRIDQISEFWGGVYFLVYGKKNLRRLAGGDIRYAYPEETTPHLLARHFQPRLYNLTHPVPLDEALARQSR